jgi:anti-sigma factor RsiW
MTCDKAAEVQAYHDRELDSARSRAIEAHVERCADCAALLAELRALSAMIADAPFPAMPDRALSRFRGAFHVAQERGMVRVAGWLTAAAAVLLVGSLSLMHWPVDRPTGGLATTARPTAWEVNAVTPPALAQAEGNSELVQVAQWMADDLSGGSAVAAERR